MSAQTIERSGERARLASWRGDDLVAHLSPTAATPLSTAFVTSCLDVLRDRGYRAVVTSALSGEDAHAFRETGFDVHEELDLLVHDLRLLPPRGGVPLHRARRRDRTAVIDLDAMSFSPFWRLHEGGLAEALAATPHSRFRVARGGSPDVPVAGFAVTGRGAGAGYVQRLAVHPAARGRGLGRALVGDALAWMRGRGASRAFVNTQRSNEGALALYRECGFRLLPNGLQVLVRAL